MDIRKAVHHDVKALRDVMARVEESGFMMANPGERQLSVAQVEKMITALQTETSALFVAEKEQEIVAYFIVQQEKMARTRHRASIVIGVDESMRGQGVGTKLFEAGFTWAKAHHVHRLELTYIAYNDAAGALYRKMGFIEEGIKRDSLYINGEYVNEYYMSRLLD